MYLFLTSNQRTSFLSYNEDDVSLSAPPPRRISSDDDNDLPGGFDDDSLSPPHHEPLIEPEEEQEVVNEELQALPEDDAQLAVSLRFVIPRETEGYWVGLVRLSVCPSVRLSVCLSVRPP